MARREVGLRAVVVDVDVMDARVWGCNCGAEILVGKAPLARVRVDCVGRFRDAGTEAVAVAEETVIEDCDSPVVVENTVPGEAVSDVMLPRAARISLSPPVGPVPRYGSAKTVYPCNIFGE